MRSILPKSFSNRRHPSWSRALRHDWRDRILKQPLAASWAIGNPSMAGMIEIDADSEWVAGHWLFDWVVGFLADRVNDATTRREFAEIVDEHLGWLSLRDRAPGVVADLEDAIRSALVGGAEEQLPVDMPGRDAAIGHIRELADRVATSRRPQ